MKRVLIGVGVLIAVLVVLPLAGNLMSGGTSEMSGATLEPSVGDAVVTPSFSGRLVNTKGKSFPNARVYMHAAIGHPEKRGQDRASMPMQHTEADGEADSRSAVSIRAPIRCRSTGRTWRTTATSTRMHRNSG